MARKLTQAERIAKIPIEQISKMTNNQRKQLESYVRTMRTGYKRRAQSFARKGLVSHAQVALEGSLPSKKPVQLTKLTRNQLILEFARYANFFNSVTSSEKGIKEVNKAQDIRLFGKDAKGRPKHTMTQEQRTKFWSLYEEYKNQNPSKFVNYGYNKIQEGIAEMVSQGDELTSENLTELMDRLSDVLEQNETEENLRSVPNVFSGRGTGFTE